MVSSFDTLRHLTPCESRKCTVSVHLFYSILDFLFKKTQHYGQYIGVSLYCVHILHKLKRYFKFPFLEKHLVPYNEFGVTQRLRLGLYVLDSAAPGDALRKQPQTKYLNTALTTGKYKKIENREVSERV